MGFGPTGASQASPPPRAARLALPTRLLRNPPDRPGHARVRRGVCVEPGRHVDVGTRTRPRRQPRQPRVLAPPRPLSPHPSALPNMSCHRPPPRHTRPAPDATVVRSSGTTPAHPPAGYRIRPPALLLVPQPGQAAMHFMRLSTPFVHRCASPQRQAQRALLECSAMGDGAVAGGY